MGRSATERRPRRPRAGPPSRGSQGKGPSRPQPPPPGEAAPTFLPALDTARAARDSETLSVLASLQASSSALRRPLTLASPRQLPKPIHPAGRPVFTSGRSRGARSGGGPTSARYGDDGGGQTRSTLPTRALWPCVHVRSTQPDRRGALANCCLRPRSVVGGVTSRGLRAGGRAAAMEAPSGKRPSRPALRPHRRGCACAARGLWLQSSFGGFTGCVAEDNERGFKGTGQEGFCVGCALLSLWKRGYRHRCVHTEGRPYKNRDKTTIYTLSRESSEGAVLPTS
ncbi:uncharacterized protein LOC116530391 [Sapajus apella]|uniref:Uncharacterized protein LOC116530391 n=1 Tax=Sapajus apella TaxID=9515 RepID=A0A6J3FF87_SAPAP|nr:uncharacterized protein LOC116530391 [Sapajus apella]